MKRSAGPAKQFNKRGGVAQLGERTVRIRKVKGSNPSVSTINLGEYRCHAVKAAWHPPFRGFLPSIFCPSVSQMTSSFFGKLEGVEPSYK